MTKDCRCGHSPKDHGDRVCLPKYGHCICAVYACRSCGKRNLYHQH